MFILPSLTLPTNPSVCTASLSRYYIFFRGSFWLLFFRIRPFACFSSHLLPIYLFCLGPSASFFGPSASTSLLPWSFWILSLSLALTPSLLPYLLLSCSVSFFGLLPDLSLSCFAFSSLAPLLCCFASFPLALSPYFCAPFVLLWLLLSCFVFLSLPLSPSFVRWLLFLALYPSLFIYLLLSCFVSFFLALHNSLLFFSLFYAFSPSFFL